MFFELVYFVGKARSLPICWEHCKALNLGPTLASLKNIKIYKNLPGSNALTYFPAGSVTTKKIFYDIDTPGPIQKLFTSAIGKCSQ